MTHFEISYVVGSSKPIIFNHRSVLHLRPVSEEAGEAGIFLVPKLRGKEFFQVPEPRNLSKS